MSHKEELNLSTRTITEYEVKAESLKNKLIDLRQKQAKFEQLDLKDVKKHIDSVGDSISKVIRKIGKWGLSIFGIRTAYMGLQRLISLVASNNEQIGTDLDYMKFAISKAFEPLGTWVVQALYTILALVNEISKAFFGINIFQKASIANYKKMKNGTNALNKTKAGFDEMQTVSSNKSSAGATPQDDLSKDNNGFQEKAKKIVDNVKGVFGEITKFWEEDVENFYDTVDGEWGPFFNGLILTGQGAFSVFKGIFEVIGGLFDWLVGVFTGDTEKMEKAAEKIWNGILDIIKGVIEIIVGLIVMIVGVIIALVTELWNAIKAIISGIAQFVWNYVLSPIIDFIVKVIDSIISSVRTFISILDGIFTTVVGILISPFQIAWETINAVFNNIINAIRNLASGFKKLFSGDIKGALNDFKSAFKNVFNSLFAIAKAPLNLIISAINSLIKGINKIKFDVPSWVPGIGGKTLGFSIPKIPKLKVGGIINMPGSGVPVGGGKAIGGEAGAEGVIPLTDEQAMETLGNAIGRHTVINLTTITQLDGRTLERKTEQIKANRDFAMNR